MPITIETSNATQSVVIRGKVADLLALAAGEVGRPLPDFGTGEADSVVAEIYDGIGGGLAVDLAANPDAHFILRLSDQEPA